jgi:iron complex outermembrane receptor protein
MLQHYGSKISIQGRQDTQGEKTIHKAALYALLAGASVLASTAALAQDAPPPPASDAGPSSGATTAPSDAISQSQGTESPAVTQHDTGGLQDIVVTAQRRAENLLTVPLSISAATGNQLNNMGIKEITSLQFTTPGFVPQNGVGYVQVYIRGIGNGVYVGTGPSVTTYIDDVPRIFSSQVNSFADVERVEVLKGAQGGLYGLNSTGGVINIISRQPSDKFTGDAKVSYGTRNTLDARAYINIPLSNHIAMNFSITRQSHDPYIKNTTRNLTPYNASMFPVDGSQGSNGPQWTNHNPYGTPAQTAGFFNSGLNPPKGLGNQNFWAADAKLRVQATDNFKVTLAADYSRKRDSEGDQWTLVSSPAALQGYVTNVFYPFIARINQTSTTAPGCSVLAPCTAPATNLPPGFVQSGKTGKWTTAASVPAHADLRDYGGSAKVEWELPNVTLTSITPYRKQATLYENDSGTDNIPYVVPVVNNHKWYWYQELRFVSTGAGPFHFLGGGTYLREHILYKTNTLFFNLFSTPLTQSTFDAHDWSVYGQVGYDLTDKLSLTTSGRYVSLKGFANFTMPAPSSLGQQATHFLPSATLSYKMNGGVLYARYAQGFKEGGTNPTTAPAIFNGGPGFSFKPEQVSTYEIGARGSLLDRKLSYTLAAFYNTYKNVQTTSGGDNTAQGEQYVETIINAGKARSYGAEASINWRPIKPVTLGFNIGYLNARYIKFSQLVTTTHLAVFNFDGRRMLYAPKWQGGFTADLDQPINNNLRLVGNLLVSYLGNTLQSLNPAQADVVQKAYFLTNMRIGVRTMNDHVGVYLYVNNVFNKYYTTFGSSSGLDAAQVEGDPRIIGGEVQIKF